MKAIEAIRRESDSPSTAAVARDAFVPLGTLQSHVAEGYTQVVVRNPETVEERGVRVPALPSNG